MTVGPTFDVDVFLTLFFSATGRRGSDDEYIELDENKTPAENLHEVLLSICSRWDFAKRPETFLGQEKRPD